MKVRSNASFFEAAAVALDSLRSSKLRSFLTLLGIILSTTTLIAVMSIFSGMDVYIANTASSMGSDGFRVLKMAFVGNFDPKKFLEMQRRNPTLLPEEYEQLRPRLTLVKEAGMSAGRGGKLGYSGDSIDVGLNAGSPSIAGMSGYEVDLGRFYSDTEDERHLEVIFLGADVKERFFPNTDPVGKTVTLDGRPFQVVGTAKAKGSVFGQSQDNFIMIPIHTYFRIYGSRGGIQYNFQAYSRDQITQAQDEVRAQIRALRHIKPGEDDTFAVLSTDTLVSAFDSLTATLAGVAIGVVSVFMVVGGVVIMNIMLAVVSERTREIGIRKSVGARQSDILNQFLVESCTLSATGGLIGVTIAWLLAVAVRNLTPVPMAVPLTAVAVGLILSTVVGLFFGIYPARQAAKLDPIVALRAEN